MDCDYYQRMFLKHGLPKVLDVDTMVNRIVNDRLSNTIPYEQKQQEYNRLAELYNI